MVLSLAGYTFAPPGYMVWCALIYAGAASFMSWRVGRPLINLNAERYAREAEFRFALVRVNEDIDGITLYRGEAGERGRLDTVFSNVLEVSRRIVGAVTRLTWVTAGYGWFTIAAPILVTAPAYFLSKMSFGELMMIVGAFHLGNREAAHGLGADIAQFIRAQHDNRSGPARPPERLAINQQDAPAEPRLAPDKPDLRGEAVSARDVCASRDVRWFSELFRHRIQPVLVA
jgi:hypothetical protein